MGRERSAESAQDAARAAAPIVLVGGGNMASAIVRGVRVGGVGGGAECAVGPIGVAEPDAGKRAGFERAFVDVAAAMAWLRQVEARPGEGSVVLAVKPQSLEAVGGEVGAALVGEARLVVTMLAGTPSERVAAACGGGVRVVRVMPNTPAAIGRGITAVSSGVGATARDVALACALFGAVGAVVEVEERMIDAFTAVAGSGPAYVFLLAEAMIEAALAQGFSADEAGRIVAATVAGSGALLEGAAEGPVELRRRVTSKGGTTEAAIGVLEAEGVRGAIVRAIAAATARARELGGR